MSVVNQQQPNKGAEMITFLTEYAVSPAKKDCLALMDGRKIEIVTADKLAGLESKKIPTGRANFPVIADVVRKFLVQLMDAKTNAELVTPLKADQWKVLELGAAKFQADINALNVGLHRLWPIASLPKMVPPKHILEVFAKEAEALRLADEEKRLATKKKIVLDAQEIMNTILTGRLVSEDQHKKICAFENDSLSTIQEADFAKIPVAAAREIVGKFHVLVRIMRLSALHLPYTHVYFYDAKERRVGALNGDSFYDAMTHKAFELHGGKLMTVSELRAEVAKYFNAMRTASKAPDFVDMLIFNALFDYNQSCYQVQQDITNDICKVLGGAINSIDGKAEPVQKTLMEVQARLDAAMKAGVLITSLAEIKQDLITALGLQIAAGLTLCEPLKNCQQSAVFGESLKRYEADFHHLNRKQESETTYLFKLDQISKGILAILAPQDSELRNIVGKTVPNQKQAFAIQQFFDLIHCVNQYIATVDAAKKMVEQVYRLDKLDDMKKIYFNERLAGNLPLSLPEMYAACELLKLNLAVRRKVGEKFEVDGRIASYLPLPEKGYKTCVIDFDETGFEVQQPQTVAVAAQKVVEEKKMEVDSKKRKEITPAADAVAPPVEKQPKKM